MSYTCRFTEVHHVLDWLPPRVYAGGISTEWVSLRDFHRAFIYIETGNMVNPLDVAVWQATNTAGAGAKPIFWKFITQLTGADDDNKIGIELQTEELDVDGGFDCIRVQTINGGAGGNIYSVTIFGIISRFDPAATTPWDEIVL